MLLKVATKNLKSQKPVGHLQLVPHGFTATGQQERKKRKMLVKDDCEGEIMLRKKEKNRPRCLSHRICRKETYSME